MCNGSTYHRSIRGASSECIDSHVKWTVCVFPLALTAHADQETHRPKWMPFCACGLVNGAYAFLLLALAVQAENTFGDRSDRMADEVEALLTNVKVILAGLEAYGVMWSGIEVMAGESAFDPFRSSSLFR